MERLKLITDTVGDICTSREAAHREMMGDPSDESLERACESLELVRDTIQELERLLRELRIQRNIGIGVLRHQDHRKMTMAEIADLAGVDDSTATALAEQAGFPERRTKRGPLCTDAPGRNDRQNDRQNDQKAQAAAN